MRVLTVKQPWASLLCEGKKDCENRLWRPKNNVGLLLIHTSKTEQKVFSKEEGNVIYPFMRNSNQEDISKGHYKEYSSIIGCVILNGVTKENYSKWCERLGNPWHWKITYPILFDENHVIHSVKGKMRIWNYSVTRELAEYIIKEYREKYNISLTSLDFPEIEF